MQRTKIESTNIASVGYDDATQMLEIEFKPGKSGLAAIWEYTPVHRSVYEAMLDPAQSPGRIFHAQIKSNPEICAEHKDDIVPEAVAS